MRELVKSNYNIFPEMISEEYARLKSDIEVNGFDDSMPITLYKESILDGWNRYKVCKELGIEASFIEFEGSDSEAIEFVIRSNKSRNLTSSQWAAIVIKGLEILVNS
jgi:ParB-like chromosome segregation protein Spo0J